MVLLAKVSVDERTTRAASALLEAKSNNGMIDEVSVLLSSPDSAKSGSIPQNTDTCLHTHFEPCDFP